MKRLFRILILTAILGITLITSVSATDNDYITLKVVDKFEKAVANSHVYVESDYGKWHPKAMYTDKNGEIRLYNQSAQLNKPVNQKSSYTVTVVMRKVDSKPIVEKFILKLATAKKGSNTVLKLKSADTKADVYKAKQRTDIYVTNSKGGAVRNMLVKLMAKSVVIPQTADSGKIKVVAKDLYASPPPNIYGYTDDDGRVTFLELPVDEYVVSFFWKDGYESKGNLSVSSADDTEIFNLSFDETLLSQ